MSEPNRHAVEAASELGWQPSNPNHFEVAAKIQLACEATAAEAVKKLDFEFCEECNCPLSACGSENPDGTPSMDCRVCRLISKHERDVDERNNALSASHYLRDKEKLRADTAEQLVLEMRGAIAGFKWLGNNLHNIKEDADRFKEFYEAALLDAEKALSLSAPIAGKWVPVEDVKTLLTCIRTFSNLKMVEHTMTKHEVDTIVEDFLAKYGDKLDNIEARRPPDFVDDGRIRPQRD